MSYAGYKWFGVYDGRAFVGWLFSPLSLVTSINSKLAGFPGALLVAKPGMRLPSSYQGYAWYSVWTSADGLLDEAAFAGWLFSPDHIAILLGTHLTMAIAPSYSSILIASHPQRMLMHPVTAKPETSWW